MLNKMKIIGIILFVIFSSYSHPVRCVNITEVNMNCEIDSEINKYICLPNNTNMQLKIEY